MSDIAALYGGGVMGGVAGNHTAYVANPYIHVI